jgi:hypothetical protein
LTSKLTDSDLSPSSTETAILPLALEYPNPDLGGKD